MPCSADGLALPPWLVKALALISVMLASKRSVFRRVVAGPKFFLSAPFVMLFSSRIAKISAISLKRWLHFVFAWVLVCRFFCWRHLR